MELKGIDVSKHQGKINWMSVASDDIHFAMIRVGIGSRKNTPTIDERFEENVQGALAAGIPTGVYLYSYALDTVAAKQEAEFTLRMIEPYRSKLTYPVAYDIEDDSQRNLGKDTLTAMCAAFCSTVASAGWKSAIYANIDWIKNRLDMTRLGHYDLWLAQWASQRTYTGNVALWQYSDKGEIMGISGKVDLNICYAEYGKDAVKQGQFAKEETNPSVTERPLLKYGSNGKDVSYLITLLAGKGLLNTFDGSVEKAIRAYQTANGLKCDGIVGPLTWACLIK